MEAHYKFTLEMTRSIKVDLKSARSGGKPVLPSAFVTDWLILLAKTILITGTWWYSLDVQFDPNHDPSKELYSIPDNKGAHEFNDAMPAVYSSFLICDLK
jgi:hypothetical protein